MVPHISKAGNANLQAYFLNHIVLRFQMKVERALGLQHRLL